MNRQRKGYGRHMRIPRNLMLDTKVLFFPPLQNPNPKKQIDFGAKAKSKTNRKHKV